MNDVNQQVPPTQPQAFGSISSSFTPPEQSSPPNWLKWAFVVIFIALLSSVGTYFVLTQTKKQSIPTPTIVQTPSPTPTPTLDKTINWKTYTNTQYKYTFKYPPEYKIDETLYGIWFADQIQIEILDRLPLYPYDGTGCGDTIVKETPVEINGVRTRKIDGRTACIIGGNTLQTYKRYIFTGGNDYFVLTLWELSREEKKSLPPDRDSREMPQDKVEIFDQMVSTLKFY